MLTSQGSLQAAEQICNTTKITGRALVPGLMEENSSNTITAVMLQILKTTTVKSVLRTAQPAWMAVEIALHVSQLMLLTFQHQEFVNAIPPQHLLR